MAREPARASVTLYYEGDDEDAADVSAALSAVGLAVREVDYVVTPPPREELKKLSVMLRDANQSLARRFSLCSWSCSWMTASSARPNS